MTSHEIHTEQTSEGQQRHATVLVVEDHQGVRETTASILREEGYVVVQTADGTEALEFLRGPDINVLLLDLRLPRMDGTAVLESLEALDEPPAVVVLSAFELFEEDEIRRRFGSVLFECLRKPVSPHRLIAVMAAAADRARSGQT